MLEQERNKREEFQQIKVQQEHVGYGEQRIMLELQCEYRLRGGFVQLFSVIFVRRTDSGILLRLKGGCERWKKKELTY
jgi:hypothetical protein